MKKNVGNIDRIIRFVICGLSVTVCSLGYLQDNLITDVFMGIAVYLLLTGIFRYCPLYHFLGVDTKTINPLKRKSHKRKKIRKVS